MPIPATVIGFIGRDPETRQVGSSSVTEFTVASSDGFGDKKTTTWVRIQVWGKAGEAAAQQLGKGAGVICTGRLVMREWSKPDGTKGQSLELNNATWDYPPTRRGDGEPSGGQSGGGRGRQPARTEYGYEDDVPF